MKRLKLVGNGKRKKTEHFLRSTLPKTNMDTQNDALEKVTAFKTGNFLSDFLRSNSKD